MSDIRPIPRRQIPRRRLRMIAIAICACGMIGLVVHLLNQRLRHSTYLTGYILLGSILFLTAFNFRKMLTFLPRIGSAATWMQLHIYVGWSTFAVFGFHVSWRIPDGRFEILLAMLYGIVALSGVYGLVITRTLPKRLTNIGQEVIFEQIPALRLQLARQARQLALGSAESSDVIPGFYLSRLLPFFERPRSLAWLVFPNGRRKRHLVDELNSLQRYLSVEHRQTGRSLSEFVCSKDDLDYHYAMQGRLKLWLFLHIGFTYSLVAISFVHAILVHAFIGGPV